LHIYFITLLLPSFLHHYAILAFNSSHSVVFSFNLSSKALTKAFNSETSFFKASFSFYLRVAGFGATTECDFGFNGLDKSPGFIDFLFGNELDPPNQSSAYKAGVSEIQSGKYSSLKPSILTGYLKLINSILLSESLIAFINSVF